MASGSRAGRPLPERIGRYRITSRLGKGAMGVVYGAHDEAMSRAVAIKVMMADLEDDPDTSARFYREARAAGQLVHRNVITIFDMGEDDGRPFIVMELLEGETLGEHLQQRPSCAIEYKLHLMSQVLDGLSAAHARGIYHRDVKPGNLFVRRDGCLKILDFGIARIASSSMTASGLIMGTPDFMSPEQVLGKEIDERSDIFSAGAVFYLMITGRKPFAAPDLPGVFNKVTREDPLPIRESEAPPAVARVVMKALAKPLDQRYQRCVEISADLSRIRKQLATEAESGALELHRQVSDMNALLSEAMELGKRLQIAGSAAEIRSSWTWLSESRHWVALTPEGQFSLSATGHEQVADARREVEHLRQRVSTEISALKRAERALADGRRAMAANQPEAALTSLELAARLVPGSSVLVAEANRCRILVAERVANEERCRAIVGEAQQASAAGQWDLAEALCDEALRVDAQSVEAKALRARAVARREDEARRRAAVCAGGVDRARTLARRGRFADAAVALAEARQAVPDWPDLATCEAEIEAARVEAERRSDRDRRAAQAIADARREFAAGRRAAAIDALEAFQKQEPDARDIRDELERLGAERRRLEDEARRAADVAALVSAAEAALAEADHARAAQRANDALAIDPGHAGAKRAHALAGAQQKAEAERRHRAELAARLLVDAREQMSRNRFKRARALVDQALAAVPGHEEASTLAAQINQREAQLAEEAEQARLAQQRARAAAPALELARAAEAAQDFVRAAWLAENALALDEHCAEARALLERVRARFAAQPTLADDTVDVVGGRQRLADPDDTVNIGPAQPAWRRIAEAVRHWTVGSSSPRRSDADGDARQRR